MLVLTFIQEEVTERRESKRSDTAVDSEATTLTSADIVAAVHEGTSRRVRPVVMTATSTIVGLLPIMLLGGTGSDVMQRIAAPMVGGMLTATFLSLLVLPVIYSYVAQFAEERNRRRSAATGFERAPAQ